MMNGQCFKSLLFVIAAFPFCGKIHAVQGNHPVAWQIHVDIAAGNGKKGAWQQNESRYDYVDDPAAIINEQDEIVFAWVDQGRKDVLLQRIDRNGSMQFPQPVNVSRSPATFSWLPRMAFSPDNPEKIFVLWQEIIFSGASHGGEIFLARSDNGGKTFAVPANISHSFGGDGKGRISRDVWHNGSFDMAAGPDGILYIVWTEYDGALWITRSTNGGAGFSEPRQIAGSNRHPARGPSIAIDRKGTVFLAWTTGETNAADILVAKSVDEGKSFSKPLIVEPNESYSDAPKLAVDSKGTLHLAYAESDSGPFGRYHVRYTRSTDGAASFEKTRNVSRPLSKPADGAAFPSMAIDGADHLVLIWELTSEHKERPKGLGITVSLDGGYFFTPPSSIPGSIDAQGAGNGSYQGLLMKKLAVNRAGVVVAVNSSMRPGESSRVWLMRGRLSGKGQ